MTFTIALVLFIICVVLAFVFAPATTLLCILAAFLVVMYVLPEVPWLAIAAATWLLLQLIAGLHSVIAASSRPAS